MGLGITLVTVGIAFVCLLLMAAVLIQNPKGGGLDSTFGGGGANQIFGAAKSGDTIEKFTWWCAGILFVLCILASYLA